MDEIEEQGFGQGAGARLAVGEAVGVLRSVLDSGTSAVLDGDGAPVAPVGDEQGVGERGKRGEGVGRAWVAGGTDPWGLGVDIYREKGEGERDGKEEVGGRH
jgi:hypothetical protein